MLPAILTGACQSAEDCVHRRSRLSAGASKQEEQRDWNRSIKVDAGAFMPSTMNMREPAVPAASLLKQARCCMLSLAGSSGCAVSHALLCCSFGSPALQLAHRQALTAVLLGLPARQASAGANWDRQSCEVPSCHTQSWTSLQVVARLDSVDQRLRQLDDKVQASDSTIQDIASKVAGMAVQASA